MESSSDRYSQAGPGRGRRPGDMKSEGVTGDRHPKGRRGPWAQEAQVFMGVSGPEEEEAASVHASPCGAGLSPSGAEDSGDGEGDEGPHSGVHTGGSRDPAFK